MSDSPVARSVWSVAPTRADSAGWLVVPASAADGVDRVHPRVDRGQQRRQLTAGCVMGVQVHRQVEAFAQRADEGVKPGT